MHIVIYMQKSQSGPALGVARTCPPVAQSDWLSCLVRPDHVCKQHLDTFRP